MTTSAGAPIEYKDARVTLNSRLIFNEYFMDMITHIVRERIPERIVHAKAAGAFGYFEVTHDITHICKAKLFANVGKRTPVAVRFSPVVVEKGGIDTSRDARGFSIKFYTEEAGIKNLRSEEARQIAAVDPDYATRDLYRAIGNGNFPSWKVSIQVLSLNDVKNAGFDVFDVTKVLPLDSYPLIPVGVFVLNKNPINYFAEIEQLAFNPANLVPGILGGPDKVFEARRLAYRDAQYYRLGANFNKIPVNCPIQAKVMAYNRDGRPPVEDNGIDSPNYYPNSYNGPEAYFDKKRTELIEIFQDDPNNFQQATELYVNEMTKDERSRLVENLLYSLGPVAKFLQDRAVKLFTIIHPDLGNRLAEGLAANRTNDYYFDDDKFYNYNK
ncbi:unnamed protein product [Parnassius apollo]|uniref:(apollo) hypothetical protein n=1 Tax=Parnassius apollo TaxID=110799 RepID=A0A8S3W4N7_PARAO|nr:unnamed protein product [Parnassius apollo]